MCLACDMLEQEALYEQHLAKAREAARIESEAHLSSPQPVLDTTAVEAPKT